MSAVFAHFHFLRPAWLLAVLLLPVLWWLWRRRSEAGNPWREVCDPHLLAHLLQQGQGRRVRGPVVLFSLGYVIALLALAGPAFRQVPEALSRNESALIVALDLSDRMRATDLKPDRLGRARYKIADLLQSRSEGQTALIAYAGDAFTVAPLTDDAKSLTDLLASLVPETMPVSGQRADRAIKLAQQLLHDAGFSEGDLLLVTDRADERAAAAAEKAAAAGLHVYVLGVGTSAGAPVALPQGGFVQDESGNVLLPKLDEDSLRAVATAGDGSYAALRVDDRDLAAMGLLGVDAGEGNLRADERTRAEYRDEGPWLLLALLPLAALAFRRGWLACFALMLCLPTQRAEAFDLASLFKRDDQRAYDALQKDQALQALELAKDPALRGSAAYRAEDYAQAEAAFAQNATADAHYNRGNALAKAARYDEAIAAYDEALKQAPDMQDAQANKQAVEAFLEQQKQQQDQQGKQDQSGDPEQSGDPQDQQKGEEQSSDQEQGSESQQEQGEPQQREGEPGEESKDSQGEPTDEQSEQAKQDFAKQMEQALKDGEEKQEQAQAEEVDPREAEKRQAVEQWLRRVPDDPGGLLRRKFALEYQRRMRENRGDNP